MLTASSNTSFARTSSSSSSTRPSLLVSVQNSFQKPLKVFKNVTKGFIKKEKSSRFAIGVPQLRSVQDAQGTWSMHAVREIPKGTCTLVERPLLALPGFRYLDTIEAELATLDTKQRETFLKLPYKPFPSNSSSLINFLDHFNTNAFPCSGDLVDRIEEDNNLSPHVLPLVDAGVYPTLSKFAHSCTPNSNYHWNESRQAMQLFSTRNIVANGEVTIAVVSPFSAREERKKLLDAKGITCECDCCQFDGEELKNSDARREQLGNLFESIPKENNAERGIRSCKVALKMLKVEGITGWNGFFSYHLFRFYAGIRQLDAAHTWFKRAKKCYSYERGVTSEVVTKLLTVNDPKVLQFHPHVGRLQHGYRFKSEKKAASGGDSVWWDDDENHIEDKVEWVSWGIVGLPIVSLHIV